MKPFERTESLSWNPCLGFKMTVLNKLIKNINGYKVDNFENP